MSNHIVDTNKKVLDENKPYCIPLYDGGFVCHTSYSAAFEDAEARRKRGEKQSFCPTCFVWVWPGECDHPVKLTTMGAVGKVYDELKRRNGGHHPTKEEWAEYAKVKGCNHD